MRGKSLFKRTMRLLNYLLSTGEVEILKKTPDSQEMLRISTANAGETIGELALIDHSPRSATVRAIKPTRFVCFKDSRHSRLIF